MSTTKIAITVDDNLVHQVDELVKEKIFANRSKAFQVAIFEKLSHLHHTRLAQECLKLDKAQEQALADEGLAEDLAQWPDY